MKCEEQRGLLVCMSIDVQYNQSTLYRFNRPIKIHKTIKSVLSIASIRLALAHIRKSVDLWRACFSPVCSCTRLFLARNQKGLTIST